jgi:HSP20 family protein
MPGAKNVIVMNMHIQHRRSVPSIWNRIFDESGLRPVQPSGPAVNISEHKDSLEFQLAVPGFLREEISLAFDSKRNLRIEGKKEVTSSDTNVHERRRDFSVLNFTKSFRLGNGLHADGIQARLENGILFVSIPKAPEDSQEQIRQIPLN